MKVSVWSMEISVWSMKIRMSNTKEPYLPYLLIPTAQDVCSSILLISSIKLADSSIITAFSEMGLNFSSDAKS